MRVVVPIDRIAASLTRGVRLTCPGLPNVYTGTRGYVDQPCAVVSRAPDLSTGRIRLELLLLPG